MIGFGAHNYNNCTEKKCGCALDDVQWYYIIKERKVVRSS